MKPEAQIAVVKCIRHINLPKPNSAICTELLSAILHKVLDSSQAGLGYDRSYDIAVRFRELAYLHFVEQKGIKWYADQLSVTENYLYRCVKRVLGKPPKEMLLEIAVIQSQLLLQDFTKSIAEVAYELNFEDPSYFGRVFKQLFGYTPTGYRNNIMQDLSE